MRYACFSTIAACLCALGGCGGDGTDVDRKDVAGSVTFAGAPVAYGHIEFVPDAAKGNSGPAGSAEIVDGRYDTSQAGTGVVEGPHIVRITAYEERPAPASEDETIPSDAKPPIVSGYAIEVASIEPTQNFEVPEDARGFNMFDDPASRPGYNEP